MKIAKAKRQECLKYFEKGYGYKKTSALTGLNLYTVRDLHLKVILLVCGKR